MISKPDGIAIARRVEKGLRPVTKARSVVSLLAVIFLSGCQRVDSQTRPANVPQGALRVGGGKAGWWQQCVANPGDGAIRCSIWNGGGEVLHAEAFVPYDQDGPVSADGPQIPPDAKLPGPDRVCLRNGRIRRSPIPICEDEAISGLGERQNQCSVNWWGGIDENAVHPAVLRKKSFRCTPVVRKNSVRC